MNGATKLMRTVKLSGLRLGGPGVLRSRGPGAIWMLVRTSCGLGSRSSLLNIAQRFPHRPAPPIFPKWARLLTVVYLQTGGVPDIA